MEAVNNRVENETNSKLAKLAGVGKETYRMGVKILDSDNEDLKQRVLSGETAISTGYKELERIYGIQHGAASFQGNQYSEVTPKVSETPTQEQLADMIGISVDTLSNYKKLTELVPELQDWVETGILAPTTVIMKQFW